MQKLIKEINLVDEETKKLIKGRINEFELWGNKNSLVYYELCFCLMTSNFNAERAIIIQNKLKKKFGVLSEKNLAIELKKSGHRFPNTRADFLFEAQKHKNSIKKIVDSFEEDLSARNWLAENIKGLGMKEASHFLRNIGRKNVAIIDFHIIDLLEKHKLIERPKTITKKKYLEIEKVLGKLGKKIGMGLASLDLYLWFLETGKVLK